MATEAKAEVTAIEKPQKHIAAVQLGTGVLFKSMAEIWATAKAFVEGGLQPKGGTVASVAAAITKGLAIGIDPITAMSKLTVINGRVKADVDLALGLVRQSGLLRPPGYWRPEFRGDPKTDAHGCHVAARRADTGESMERGFTIAEAKRAGLWGKDGPWSGYPQRMLYKRAAGFLIDDLFSDVVLGLDDDLPDLPPGEIPPDLAVTPSPSGPDPILEKLLGAGPVAPPSSPAQSEPSADGEAVSAGDPKAPPCAKCGGSVGLFGGLTGPDGHAYCEKCQPKSATRRGSR